MGFGALQRQKQTMLLLNLDLLVSENYGELGTLVKNRVFAIPWIIMSKKRLPSTPKNIFGS